MIDSRATPTVYSIPGTERFLETLHDHLVAGDLLPGWTPTDPLEWADLTILVPTRRAGRALRDLFLDRAGGDAVILPRIRPIGDVEEDHPQFDVGDADPDLAPAVSGMERHLVLTRLILGWTRALNQDGTPVSPVRIPASPADASWLAHDLAALMDQVATEEADWSGLTDLVPEDFAAYWQMSLTFLQIATRGWPAYLAERGLMEPAARRSLLIDREAHRLMTTAGDRPIVAAGSTGSIPATARLLKVIARLPLGAVVLPGLTDGIDDESWAAVGEEGDDTSSPSHPFYGMRHLVNAIGINRAGIIQLTVRRDDEARDRQDAVADVFRPAQVSDHWQDPSGRRAAALAFRNIALVEAPGDYEESVAIALALRGFLEDDPGIAALVTPDRRLARRVAGTLRRWGIEIDDSGGRPLSETPSGVLARLVAETALSGFEPLALISLLKHPLARFGSDPAFIRGTARALETGVLRGPPVARGLDGLKRAIASARKNDGQENRYDTRHQSYLKSEDWNAIDRLVGLLEEAFAPLAGFADAESFIPLPDLFDRHVRVLRAVARDADGDDAGFFASDDGSVLVTALAGMVSGADKAGIDLETRDYPDFFDSLIAGVPVRPRRAGDSRLHIWSPLEARLMSPDLIVLGGLNEGVWPALPETDAWLSRPMRAGLSLQPPERRIGLSAHDFMQGLSNRRVLLTRSERSDGSPTIASRWLQRLRPVLGEAEFDALGRRGRTLLDWTHQLDRPQKRMNPALRPCPSPPIEARPRRLSVTEVETLIRDPYAYYARRVLDLEPIAVIGAMPDFSDRGTLVHDAVGDFVADWTGSFDNAAEARLLAIGRDLFADLADFPDIRAIWWARFTALAKDFIRWEAERDAVIDERFCEIDARIELTPGDGAVALTGRADRIDRRKDGSFDILDFKTGAVPTVKQVKAGFAPQLPLEGAILKRGGFKGLPAVSALGRLTYVQLRSSRDGFVEREAVDKGLDTGDAAEAAFADLSSLLTRYRDPEQGYLSRAYPLRAADHAGRYDHLARVGEWSLADAGDDA